MPKPFFTLNDDKGNPINKALNKAAESGNHFGDSRSLDKDGAKYPKGFTPPVDLYVNPESLDAETGLPVEYGASPVYVGGSIVEGKNKSTISGFTPRSDLYVDSENIDESTGLPVEYGTGPTKGATPVDTEERLSERKVAYNFFRDYESKQFTHLLDYFNDMKGQPTIPKILRTSQQGNDGSVSAIDTKQIYLGSFIMTSDENEDPTMLGYDIEIDLLRSPLFNGEIDIFIDTFGQFNSEIASRKQILINFKKQLLNFLKSNVGYRKEFDGTDGTKTYYLKNLTGLNNLVESNTSSEIKSFVDYGKTFITLQFNEDVDQNLGYLASLYKTLAWSRINGKQVIPENLLRFDMKIKVSEVRKYNRVFKNVEDPTKFEILPDLLSRYDYTLYECQFFFDSLPHGDSLDLSAPKTIDTYDIKINYKFSTMKFIKFRGEDGLTGISEGRIIEQPFIVNNAYYNLMDIKPEDTNTLIEGDNTLKPGPPTLSSEPYLVVDSQPIATTAATGDTITDLKTSEKSQASSGKTLTDGTKALDQSKGALAKNKPFDKLKKDLKNAGIREINRQILAQAALLNKTLDNIRNAIPGAGRMSEPTNVYTSNKPLQNDLINAARNFVGASIRGFFTNP